MKPNDLYIIFQYNKGLPSLCSYNVQYAYIVMMIIIV